jgi:hypothetical protein
MRNNRDIDGKGLLNSELVRRPDVYEKDMGSQNQFV